MSAQPLLTICIPTYNRAGHVEKLLEFLTSNAIPGADYDIELIVVNNCSKDNTREVLERLRAGNPALRVIHRDEFLLTAEENIVHSLQFCSGEYVWFLGDDDVPVLQNFPEHYRRLKEGQTDYFLFNPAMQDCHGTVVLLQNIQMNRDALTMSMAELVITVGCLFNIAGISNQIIRRRLLTTGRGLHFMQRSKIYSMVAWIIDAAKGAVVTLVNRPLVYYRTNDYGDQHWPRVAKRLDVGDFYFWSLGLVDLFEQIIADGALTPLMVGQITEITSERGQTRFVDDMLGNFYMQLTVANRDPAPRQLIDLSALERAARFFARVDATTYDLVECLRALRTAIAEGAPAKFADAETRFHILHQARRRLGRWSHRVEQVCYGYEILRTPVQYTAVFGGNPAFRDEVMRTIDPLPSEPLVLTAATREELYAQLVVAAPRAHALKQSGSFAALIAPLNPQPEPVPEPVPAERIASSAAIAALQRALALEAELRTVYHSSSWQLTYALRAAKNGLQSLRSTRHLATK